MSEPMQADDGREAPPGATLGDVVAALRRRALLLVLGPLVVGAIAVGSTFLVAPTFTASAVFLPPQGGQNTLAAALGSLGSLAGLAGGGGGGVRNSGEQVVALMQSATVSDRVIERFKLREVYEVQFLEQARRQLARRVRIGYGKRDGLVTVEVDDHSPQRAAEIANRYVEELRFVTSRIAVTEAQQRRAFFEQKLKESRDQLVKAQQALQSSGFNPGALKAEPKSAAETYARLRAEITTAEVRLQALLSSFTDAAPEVRQQRSALEQLRAQMLRVEANSTGGDGPDFISRYREFKYQETLFELYARQFELARVDESREGALVQVVDEARPPELKSKPQRGLIGAGAWLAATVLVSAWTLARSRLGAAAHT